MFSDTLTDKKPGSFILLQHTNNIQLLEQMLGVEEDKLCKPNRPFPSGRVSSESGQSLYLSVIAICIAASVYHGLTAVSLAYMLAIWLYNEFGLSTYPIHKNVLGAVGYVCYCWGTTYIIGKPLLRRITRTESKLFYIGHHQPMSSTSTTAILFSGLIFTLTVQSFNFF
jgi:4-hydroxybenzoate polyprenyltransferase